VALLDSKGGIETANQRLLSFVDPESSSAQANLAALVVPEERDNFLRLLDHTEEEGGSHGPHSTELHLALAGRGRRLFKCTIGWIRETGQICVFLDDITEQRVMERQMAQKEKSALLDSLVGGIAHELNNKLTPVLGFSQMISQNLRKQPDTAKLHEFAQTITESAIESAKIIRQLLQMSRPPARELVRCDLRAVVQDALTLAKFKLRENQIQPRLELPPAEVPLIADPAQLKQVVVNIVFNAVDVMDNPDRRELKLRVTAGRGQAALLIADTGHGIQPEHLNRIFDPFFTTKSPDRGTGLGLSVCFSIVKQHGGEINVESTPGEGTTFTITLPQADDAAATAPTPPAEDTSATTARVIRARILVVDDEPFVTRLVQEMLRSETDCKVEWAADGVQATERLKDSAFDLVISDIRMPRMNGFQLLDWIKGHFPPMAARFIFMTGDAGSVEMNGALDELGVPVLRKPFSANSLLDHCRSLIRP
jgi:two-component system NtrC family sensor kinase